MTMLSDVPVMDLRPGIKVLLLNGKTGFVQPLPISYLAQHGYSPNGVTCSNDDDSIYILEPTEPKMMICYHRLATNLRVF